MTTSSDALRRWRLILGQDADSGNSCPLGGVDGAIDRALEALYGRDASKEKSPRSGGLGPSSPNVARWLGDIRSYFPSTVVRVMQQDALQRLDLKRMLLEPEFLSNVEPDINLVANLMALSRVIPERTKDTARQVVRKVVEELQRKLDQPTRQAILGSLARSVRNRRPRFREVDWNRTIRANLRHYQPDYRTVVPETRIGYGRKRSSMKHVILLLDQSGSMAQSVVYSAVFGSVMASMPALSTRVIAFDTAVVDLTEELSDPVDVLFGVQLGGGTDIHQAMSYAESLMISPQETIIILISDLIEGGTRDKLVARAQNIVASGATLVALLALSDEGSPSYDHQTAAAFSALGSPAFACTPDLFPELMAAAIQRQDLSLWAAERDILIKM
jgi:Mg-chelatase subunit ChlD